MSKKQQLLAQQLTQTGRKARAMILSIQPTGVVMNIINIQCVVTFRLEPLQGGQPFDAHKTDSAGPDVDAAHRRRVAAHEFGIPHPLDLHAP